MARTRSSGNAKSSHSGDQQRNRQIDHNIPTESTVKDEISESPPASFKQDLQRFHYDETSRVIAKPGLLANLQVRNGVKRPSDSRESTASPTKTTAPSSKKRRVSSKYAPPAKYAHLPKLLDVLEPNLICVFVGTNPGIRTATSGHAYAHPSNMFWKLLHSSGCTERRCRPEEDVDMPRLYAMGNTNIVERPTKDAGELSKAEMTAGAPILDAKIRHFRPEAVCIVGKGIWEAIWRHRHGRNPSKAESKYGWQDEGENMGQGKSDDQESTKNGSEWKGVPVFVASSTSGLSASTKPAEKEAIWKPFGEWVKARRAERMIQHSR